MLQRVKEVQESDLRMNGALARNIQRVLAVTQAQIDAAAAQGQSWFVKPVVKVSDPLDNLRGGTQLVIKQNSILPGQNVMRVIYRGGQAVVVGPGVAPLSLPDAAAEDIMSLIAFGGTEQRNIPQPYTQVNYVTNTAQTAVDTGIMIDFAKNYEFEVECRAVSGSWYILQSRASASGNVTGIHGETSGSTIKLVVGNVTVCTSAITRTVGNKLYVKATLNNGTATLYVKDETANTEDTQTGSYGTTQPNPTAAVYLLGNAGGQYVDVNSDIYMARIKENDTVVMDYVPARQVATAGFYDTVSGTFKTAETPANLSADGNTVPAPDAPMNIVSNNGVLKAYTQLFVNGNLANGTTNWLIETLTYTDTADYAQFYNARGSSVYLRCTPPTRIAGHKYAYLLKAKNSGGTTPWGARNGVQLGLLTTTETAMAGIDTFPSGGSGSPWLNIPANTTIYVNKSSGFRLYDLTALGLDNTITTAEQAIAYFGDTYTEPGEIYTDGTVETINVHGKNLFDKSDVIIGKILNDSGSIVNENNGFYSANIPVSPNTTYTVSQNSTGSGIYLRVLEYNNVDAMVKLNKGTTAGVQNETFTTSATTKYVIISGINAGRDTLQLELGSTATEYAPYYNGGTATAEMLLKVGNYQDQQEIIGGTVTRKVGVKVLDGTEGWVKQDASSGVPFATFNLTLSTTAAGGLSNVPRCSHFGSATNTGRSSIPDNGVGVTANPTYTTMWFRCDSITTTNDLTAWLAAQYAAGTPVIVIYPLATPTTETVTGQPMATTQGTNIAEITQASLDGLELEVEYIKDE